MAKFSRFDAVASFSVMDVWWHHSTEKRVSLNKFGSPTDLKVTIYGGSGNLITTQPVLLWVKCSWWMIYLQCLLSKWAFNVCLQKPNKILIKRSQNLGIFDLNKGWESSIAEPAAATLCKICRNLKIILTNDAGYAPPPFFWAAVIQHLHFTFCICWAWASFPVSCRALAAAQLAA